MSKPSQVIVLAEDQRQQILLRRYLVAKGMRPDQLRFNLLAPGKGSAEQRVRETYPREVGALRKRQAKAQTALIVMIDADTMSVVERLEQLDGTLRNSRIKPVDREKEQIARLVPKRNVETWILCLNENAVDEETDFKAARDDWTALIPTAAERLSEGTRNDADLPAHWVQSLRAGVSELLHVDFGS